MPKTNAELTAEIKNGSFVAAKAIVKDKLLNDNEWLLNGLMCLYARQTDDEQAAQGTKYRNARGFNSSDAELLTSFALQWKERNWVSDKQLYILRRKLVKYAGQLARVVRGEEAAADDAD